MNVVVTFIHVVVCIALILIVLLQTGKGAEMGAGLRGSSQTIFGGTSGTTFLGKLTTGAAALFMITCLILAATSGTQATRSIMENVPADVQKGPAIPEAKPVLPTPNALPPGAPAAPGTTVPGQTSPAAPTAPIAPPAGQQ